MKRRFVILIVSTLQIPDILCYQKNVKAEAILAEIDEAWASFLDFVPAEHQKKISSYKHKKQNMSKILALITTEPKPDGLQQVILSVILTRCLLISYSDRE